MISRNVADTSEWVAFILRQNEVDMIASYSTSVGYAIEIENFRNGMHACIMTHTPAARVREEIHAVLDRHLVMCYRCGQSNVWPGYRWCPSCLREKTK